MTILKMGSIPLRKTEDNTQNLSMDFETFPDTGIFRYGHIYGYVNVKEDSHFINPATGRRKTISTRKSVLIDRGFWNQQEMLDFILSLRVTKKNGVPARMTVFNLSHDYEFFRKIAKENELLTAGGRIVYAELKNNIKVQDIANHSPGESLDGWITSLKMNIPTNNRCGERIEKTVYREDMTDAEIEQHCRWDAMATWELTEWWVSFLKQYGLTLRLTIGSQAIDAHQRLFFKDDEGNPYFFKRDDNDEANDFFRQGYYGGRVELWYGYRLWTELACFDINSTYPDAMIHNNFPDPMSLHWGSLLDDWEKRLWEQQGFYECDVYVPPNTHIPVLPTKEESGKLLFKTGYIHGVWVAEELRYAIECGAEIIKCHRYVWFSHAIPFFRDFEQWCVDKRAEMKATFGKKSPQEQAFKRLGNAAYGKYGQRVSDDAYVGSLEGMPPDLWDKCDIEATLNDNGEWMISYPGTRKIYSEKSFLEMAAYVTAFARLKLVKAAHAAEKAGYIACYADTDSLKLTNPAGAMIEGDRAKIGDVIDVGESLGQWEFEGLQRRYLAAPKLILAKDDFGVVNLQDPINRIKGLKKDAETTQVWSMAPLETEKGFIEIPYLESIEADLRRPLKLKEAIRRGERPSKWIEQHKTIHPEDTKRNWRLVETPMGIRSVSSAIYSEKSSLPSLQPLAEPPAPPSSRSQEEQSIRQNHTEEKSGQG
jgi:hypothetical protein